jgi:hypothetical protein
LKQKIFKKEKSLIIIMMEMKTVKIGGGTGEGIQKVPSRLLEEAYEWNDQRKSDYDISQFKKFLLCGAGTIAGAAFATFTEGWATVGSVAFAIGSAAGAVNYLRNFNQYNARLDNESLQREIGRVDGDSNKIDIQYMESNGSLLVRLSAERLNPNMQGTLEGQARRRLSEGFSKVLGSKGQDRVIEDNGISHFYVGDIGLKDQIVAECDKHGVSCSENTEAFRSEKFIFHMVE